MDVSDRDRGWMKSAHPDDSAASGELVILISGSSIELNALKLRLESAGARVMSLPEAPTLEAGAALGDLLVCDLASDGALAAVQRLWSGTPEELLDKYGISARHIVAAVRG